MSPPPRPFFSARFRRRLPWRSVAAAVLGIAPWTAGGTLLLAPPRAAAQTSVVSPEPLPLPGQHDFYVGSVSQFLGPGASPRLGVARLEIGDGLLTGYFLFPADEEKGTVEVRADCQGSIDATTGRGLLKVHWIDPNALPNAVPAPSDKMSVLLKRGVLTGGTMGSDGGVLAFRLERAFVILP